MTYEEYRKQRQAEFDALPIFFAFSAAQFAEAMEKRGLTENDTDKICRIPGGGFCLKTDLPTIRAFVKKPDPIHELMKDKEFAESAFYYEMCNHEYGINYQADYDVCSCFVNCEYGESSDYNDYLRDAGCSEQMIEAYKAARRRYFTDAEKNEWY